VRIFKGKPFARFARKSRIPDAALCQAVADIENGRIDADLGGGVFKQRIARSGAGKSGGFRALILIKLGDRAFFIEGFAKNERDNIRDDELYALKKLAAELLHYDDAALEKVLATEFFTEVKCDDQAIS
jgi:hypothetical protein